MMLGIPKRPKKILQTNDQMWNGKNSMNNQYFHLTSLFLFCKGFSLMEHPGFLKHF